MENDGISRNCNLSPGHCSSDGGRLQQHTENDVPIARPTTLFLPSALQGEGGRRRHSSTLDDASSIVRVTNVLGASSNRVLRANSVPLMSTLSCLPAVASALPPSCLLSPSPHAAGAQHFRCMPSSTDGLRTASWHRTSGDLQPVSCLTTDELRQVNYITTASLTPITPSQPTTLTSLMPGPAVVSPSSVANHNLTNTQQLASLSGHPLSSLNNQTSVIFHPDSLSQNLSGPNKFLTSRTVSYNQESSNFSVVNHTAPPICQSSIGFSSPVISCLPNTLTPVTPTANITVLSHQEYQDLVSSQSLNSDFIYMKQPGGNVIEMSKSLLSQHQERFFYEFNPPALPEPISLSQLRSNSFPIFNGNKFSTVPTSPGLKRSPSISSLDRNRCWSNFLQTELTPIDTLENSIKTTDSTAGPSNGVTEPNIFYIGNAPSSPPNLVAPPVLSPKAGCLGVDLRLTMPCSPPVPESGDETAFSFQDCETATLHDSDLDSVDSDYSVDVARRARRRGLQGRNGTATPPEHFVIGGVLTDGDFDAGSSVVLEDEPIFDEYEPVSDQDETAVVELSDSDIDAGFAVTAAALAAAEAESQLSDEFADQSAMESNDGVDTDELDMAGFLIAFRRKEKRRRRDGSRKSVPSSALEEGDGLVVCREASQCRLSSGCSDSDHDLLPADRWRCLECNQLNNKSFFRYCEKCWKMRRGWLPDPPKKRRKRKPRKRAHRRRTTSTKACDGPPTDTDATNDPSVAAGTSRQAADGGESSKSCTTILAAAGPVSCKDSTGPPGTSRQAGEMVTCGGAEEIDSIPPKGRMSKQVVQGEADGTEQTRTTGAECSPGQSLDGRTDGQHSRVIVKSRPCSDLDDPSGVKGGNLPIPLPVNTKVLNVSCVRIEPGVSGEEIASNKTKLPEAGVEVICTDDFVNYDSGINSCDGLSNTCLSKMDHETVAVNAKAGQLSNSNASEGTIRGDHLRRSSVAGPSADDSKKAQSSQTLETSNLSADSFGMNYGEDAIDGATSNGLKRTLHCGNVQENGFKSDRLTPVDAPSTSGIGCCVSERSEGRGGPLKRLSLSTSSSSLDSSLEHFKERARIQSNVQGSCELDSTPSSSKEKQNANVPPTFTFSERHSSTRYNTSESLIGHCNVNSASWALTSVKNDRVCIADSKHSLSAGEVCSAGRTLKRTLSTASTVSANNSFISEHGSDSASTEDELAHVDNDYLSRVSLTSILEHNTLMSIKQHVDSIDAPKQLPVSSPAAAEFECKSLSSDHHDGADLDRFSTHSATDSVQSVIDSGLGSSQDLFQDSPLGSLDNDNNVDDLLTSSSASRHPDKKETAKLDLRRKNKTSIYSKKVSHWKGDKGGRKRSNSNSAVVEIVDVYIEDISSENESSSKLSDRGTKRKYIRDGSCKRSPSMKKRACKDNSPLKRYLTNGLLLNSDEVDVTSLSSTHSTRIISSAIADFLRSKDAHSWLATDVGRSWVSSASVQAMLLASLTGGGGRSGGAAGMGESAPVDVRTENLCIMCQDRPKDAAIIHGKTSHQTTCYKCAKMLFARKQRCPVCRRKILRISKNIIV